MLLMVVLVLRGLTGTAMAAGVLPPLLPPGAQHGHPQEQQSQAHHHGGAPSAPASAGQPVASAQNALPGTPAPEMTTEPESGHGHEHGHDHDPAAIASAPADRGACDDGATASCAAHDHHSAACSACDICHSAMLDAPAARTPGPVSTGAPLPLASAQFDSAPAALAIKPPIA